MSKYLLMGMAGCNDGHTHTHIVFLHIAVSFDQHTHTEKVVPRKTETRDSSTEKR